MSQQVTVSTKMAAILDCSRQVEYKVIRYDGTVVFVDRFYPSSKTCANCGEIQEIS
ncbi:MAG: zinc ribbon domain-containing protein [Gloeotrichia echinulata IR180]|nr:transposase [Gloeotrichia echinulata DEX184]